MCIVDFSLFYCFIVGFDCFVDLMDFVIKVEF